MDSRCALPIQLMKTKVKDYLLLFSFKSIDNTICIMVDILNITANLRFISIITKQIDVLLKTQLVFLGSHLGSQLTFGK